MSPCRDVNKIEDNENKDTKKAFNKKKWREQKYSCKAKVQRWESIRRKQAQKHYSRECKKFNVKIHAKNDDENRKNKPLNGFKEAHMQYKKIQEIKEEKRKEQERIRNEKEQAIKAYKEKKAARFRKLSQKTRKGQPLMRGRIELLLEKIQKQYANNTV